MFAELVSNLSILVILGVLSSYFKGLQPPLTLKRNLIIGLLYGIVAVIGMNIPFTFADGLIFDGRSVIISMAAFFFGILPTTITVVIATAYRIFIGGAGLLMGISVIISSAFFGLGFNYLKGKGIVEKNVLNFFLLGLTVHISMVLLMNLLPTNFTFEVFVKIAPLVLLLYIPFTIVFGIILKSQEQRLIDTNLLKESEERYRSIFENSSLGIYRTTPEGRILLANPALINMLGYENFEDIEKLELKTECYAKVIDRSIFLEEIEKEGYVNGFEGVWKKKNGELINVIESARAFRDENGKIIYFEGIVEDITIKKMMDKALRDSEQQFKSLTQEAPVGIFRTDPEGNTTFVNPRWTEITGLGLNEAKGLGWLEAVHYDDKEFVRILWMDAIDKKRPSSAEYRFLHSNGAVVWVSGRAVPQVNDMGELVGYIGTTTDITHRKIAEQSLMDSEAKFRTLIEMVPVGIVVSDKDQKNLFVNRRFEEHTGYSLYDQPTVDHWWPLAYPDEVYREKLKRYWNEMVTKAIENRTEVSPIECEVTCKDGSVKIIDIGFVSIGDVNIVTFVDVTARKKAEYELLKLKDELEDKVKDKTQELNKRLKELEEFREITLSREFRIAELKDEIKKLKREL